MGQLLVEGGEPKRNLERAQLMIEEASKKNCDFILLPECLDLGWTHPSLKTEALTIPGLYSNKISEYAENFNIYVCAGLTEKEDNKIWIQLTDDMKKWSVEALDNIWIPTIMTLPDFMLYPFDDEEGKMKWGLADMIDIPEEDRKNYPIEGQEGKFYERK